MPGSCWRPFTAAADRVGLGSRPISAIRNHAAKVSEILGLPNRLSGGGAGRRLAVLRRRDEPAPRLDVTIHRDRYDEQGFADKIAAYDRRREAVQPYRSQRYRESSGRVPNTAGRRTRHGNIRCQSGPISEHSCAAGSLE